MSKSQDSSPKSKSTSKKKYWVMAGIFIVCAFALKRDAH